MPASPHAASGRNAATLALIFLASAASAQELDAQRFTPATGATGGLMVERTTVPRHLSFGAGVFLNYANDPVVLVDRDSGEVFSRPLAHALTLDLLGSIGLFDFAEVGLHLPVHLLYDGDAANVGGGRLSPNGGLGDLRVVPKARFFRKGFESMELALAGAATVTLPTGDAEALRGAGGVTVEPRILLGLLGRRFGANASAGARLLTPLRSEALVGHEATVGIAGAWAVLPSRDVLDLVGEVVGSWDLSVEKPGLVSLASEARLAAVWKPHPTWHLYAGCGAGLTPGLGSPDFRALVGVRFAPRGTPGALRDADSDGIPDAYDACPNDPEDRDGVADDDGCPEPEGPPPAPEEPAADRDGDGVTDETDECPDHPGPKSNDGCPDPGEVRVEKGRILVLGKVRFETGSANIHPSSARMVDEIARTLQAHPELTKIRIVGHTDDVGEDAFNQRLSEERALSVKNALVKRGLEETRLVTDGRGESQPVAPNNTAAGRARNRRVEFIVEEER